MSDSVSSYSAMPQNDVQQLNQIIKEYETEPAKGLAHGVQKDAIQNAVGARLVKSLPKAFLAGWSFFIELIEINGNKALCFWDEGTHGLTGEILSSAEINKHSANGLLGSSHADQRLSRFLTRFESGGNDGPGCFGRGKLIFQAASNNHHIFIDSLRDDDYKYIALDRKVDGSQIVQSDIPKEGKEAEQLLSLICDSTLEPLKKPGTRIVIFDIDQELEDAFLCSFKSESSQNFSNSLHRMIEETWWEILQRNANIVLRHKDKDKKVEISDKLNSLLCANDKKGGYRVYHKKNISIDVKGYSYNIKELKLITAPSQISEDLTEVWVQRKAMKIGAISKSIPFDQRIAKKTTGYIRLDKGLEALFEKEEGITHYSFNLRKSIVQKVREVLRNSIDDFQKEQGYRTENTAGRIHNELNDSLKELNELADNLGLPKEFAFGASEKKVRINLKSIELPDQFSSRIELEDSIGPIIYRVINNGGTSIKVNFYLSTKQGGNELTVFKQHNIELNAGESKEIVVDSFVISKDDYSTGCLTLRAYIKRNINSKAIDSVSRILWIGMTPKQDQSEPIKMQLFIPKFPHKKTKRVEYDERISNLGMKLSNQTAMPIELKVNGSIRKSNPFGDPSSIGLLYTGTILIAPFADEEIPMGDLVITENLFKTVFAEPNTEDERKCELMFKVKYAQNYTLLV